MRDVPYVLAQENLRQPILLICADAEEALYCADLMAFWSPTCPVYSFPNWDTLPYDIYDPSPNLIQERLRILAQLRDCETGVIICAVEALQQRLPPETHLDLYGTHLNLKGKVSLETLKKRLQRAKYQEVRLLKNRGEMVVFPQQLDFYPLNAPDPIRVRWQNNEIASIQTLDIQTNLPKIQTQSLTILPDDEILKHQGEKHSGVSKYYFLTDYFSELSHLFAYLPADTQTIYSPKLKEALSRHEEWIQKRFQNKNQALSPRQLWLSPDEVFKHLNRLPIYSPSKTVEVLEFTGNDFNRQQQWADYEAHYDCVYHSLNGLYPHSVASPLRHSFKDGETVHLSALDLNEPSKISTPTPRQLLNSLADIQLGEPIIHHDFGVGRYRGLETIEDEELIKIEYAKGAHLYLSVRDFDLLSPFGGNAESAPLHELGGKQWKSLKEKIQKETSDVAVELLALYAEREKAEGIQIETDKSALEAFALGFPYHLTPDQESAIEAVLNDLASPKPMERLLCGDVGFGKTEVALRACFTAVQAGYQVALIAPTTLLAEQHEQKFIERFQGLTDVYALSRFKTAKAQKEALLKLSTGEAKIVIGTHRLLQDDVAFKNLGLLIIDEEQRFGVKAKEYLKKIRSNINILSLSATPIPRSLNLALNGLRDLSIMNTPPKGRQNIKTLLYQWDEEIVREACQRELARGGQIYFLYNDVASMPRMMRTLEDLLPEMRIRMAHGQMKERELEHIMRDFQEKRFDLLISSTIIESGIDVPNANTILIHRADKFGLGQLHQLRGRVGRSRQQAYAYLFVPHENQLTADAKKRLDAFTQLNSLGAGFLLASQDLEIRGAGAILGSEQSGQMASLGVAYYLNALESALKQNTQKIKPKTQLDLGVNTYFSADEIKSPQVRMAYYQRLAQAQQKSEIQGLQREINEKYGAFAPDLFQFHQIRLLAEQIGIQKISKHKQYWHLEMGENPQIRTERLLQALQKDFHLYKMINPQTLQMTIPAQNPLIHLERFLIELAM